MPGSIAGPAWVHTTALGNRRISLYLFYKLLCKLLNIRIYMCNALHTSWPQCPRTVPNLYHSGWQIQPKCLVSKNSIGLWCPATCCCCRKPRSRHIWSGAHYISIIYHIRHAGTLHLTAVLPQTGGPPLLVFSSLLQGKTAFWSQDVVGCVIYAVWSLERSLEELC